MDHLLHILKNRDITDAPRCLQGECSHRPFLEMPLPSLGYPHAGVHPESCTATAQIVAYWLTDKVRTLATMIHEEGKSLAEWWAAEHETLWSTIHPQLITIDIQAHKFSVCIFPGERKALLLQSNQWPGEPYTLSQWLRREGACQKIPYFVMSKGDFDVFMKRLLNNTLEDTLYLFGHAYKWKVSHAKVVVSDIDAFYF